MFLHFQRSVLTAVVSAAVVVLAACSDGSVAPSSLASATPALGKTAETPAYGPWARIVTGETGPGSLYAIYVPTNWNGDAVSVAHGFRDVASPIDLRDQDGLYATREALGALGYAVAYSSYSENGFAVKDGALRTHQLRGLLASVLGRAPARHFLVGYSLGGGVALSLAEQYPTQYAGALTVCGIVGGSRVQTQYLGHVRALFDSYYTGVAPGDVLGVPDGTTITIPQIAAAVSASPLGLLAMASTKETPLPFVPSGSVLNPNSTAAQTLVGSLWAAVSFHARGINNILDLTHGKSPFENANTTYTLGTPVGLPAPMLEQMIAATNDSVARYRMTPASVNYLTHNFTPSGNLRIPLLTVHNVWDPAVPLIHEVELAKVVQAAGTESMLLQRQVPLYGHCVVPAPVIAGAFNDLVGWATTGVKPAP
jgi:pimeloyl-ACP methyl ester carboxylesterase